jgi:signal transduction histidine kinase
MLSRNLRPPELDDVGLVGAVRQFTAGLAATTSVVDELPGPLPASVEPAASRVVTEAVMNAERHSGAASVQIRLHTENGALHVEVTDDGAGIDPGTRPGVGMTTMRERAEELGGSITVAAGRGGGTSLACELPLGLPVLST